MKNVAILLLTFMFISCSGDDCDNICIDKDFITTDQDIIVEQDIDNTLLDDFKVDVIPDIDNSTDISTADQQIDLDINQLVDEDLAVAIDDDIQDDSYLSDSDAPEIKPKLKPSSSLALTFKIVKAEFNKASGQIVAISNSPSEIHLINPITKVQQKLPLDSNPDNLSLNENSAAVSSGNIVYYISLSPLKIEKKFELEVKIGDIILAPNDFIYAFPDVEEWESIHSIEISSGNITKSAHWSIHGGAKAKLHPLGDYIYGVGNGRTPVDLEKYDIRKGTANYLYDSPYHGEYDPSGDLWISQDGLRIISSSGELFSLSNKTREDLIYNGKLPTSDKIKSVAHLLSRNLLFVIFESHMEMFNYSYSSSVSEVELIEDVNSSLANDVFFSNDGTSIFVIYEQGGKSNIAIYETPKVNINYIEGKVDPGFKAMNKDIQILPFNVIDAAYNITDDQMIVVSSLPNKLNLIDMVTREISDINLPKEPVSVDISPDNSFVAIGYSNLVTVVNLISKKIVKTYDIASEFSKVIFTKNSISVPISDSKFIFIDLASDTREEISSTATGVYTMEKSTKGDHLFTKNEIYFIESGKPKYISTTLNDSENQIDPPFWISAEKELITKSGQNFIKAPLDTYLSYKQTYMINNQLLDLASSVNTKYFTAITEKDSTLFVFENSISTLKNSIDLPFLAIDNNLTFKLKPKNIFFSRYSHYCHIIYKSENNAPVLKKFGIVSIKTSDLIKN